MSDELREFLRSRRARLSPEEVGLPVAPGRRRVPGLRREEVAALAGMSVDYYIRLERGRTHNVSDSVLAAVARSLRLDAVERGHLFALARPGRRAEPPPEQRVRGGVTRVLDSLVDTPALVLGRRRDVLAINRMAEALFADFAALPPGRRNLVRYLFLVPAARSLYPDWEQAARGTVASLQLYAGRNPHDPLLDSLVAELCLRDEDFRRWWNAHDVMHRTSGNKHLRHPLVGDLELEYELLNVADDPEQTLCLYTAEPGSAAAAGLRELAGRGDRSAAAAGPAGRPGRGITRPAVS